MGLWRLTLVTEFPVNTQVTAVRLVLRESETGAEVGTALVCVEARYLSVAWRGESRLSRVHVSPAGWRAVAAEVAPLSPGDAIQPTSTVYHLIRAERAARVTCATVETVTAKPSDLVHALDVLIAGVRL